MLSLKEWSKQKVVKWESVKNCDTKTVESGYLFLREDDGLVTGCKTHKVSSRAEAIAYHYGLYVKANKKPVGFECRGCGCIWDTISEVSTCCSGFGWNTIWQDETQSNLACGGFAAGRVKDKGSVKVASR